MPEIANVKAVNVTLYPEQIEIVRQYADYTRLLNFSAALRMIITEWAREHNGRNEQTEQETAA